MGKATYRTVPAIGRSGKGKTVETVGRAVVTRAWRGGWGGMSTCSGEGFLSSKTASWDALDYGILAMRELSDRRYRPLPK